MRLIDFDAKIQKNADYNDGISIFFCTFAAVYEEDCINNIVMPAPDSLWTKL